MDRVQSGHFHQHIGVGRKLAVNKLQIADWGQKRGATA